MIELNFFSDVSIKTGYKSGHGSLTIFIYIGSDHGNLHFFMIVFDTPIALFKILESLEQITVIMFWDKSPSHGGLHFIPSLNWGLTVSSPTRVSIPLGDSESWVSLIKKTGGCSKDQTCFFLQNTRKIKRTRI
ncbi:hypothetical protein GQ457_10G004970 [Hibiscus cannabinus]